MEAAINKVFDDAEQVKILKELIRIPSENPGNTEEQIVLSIKRMLENENIKVTLDYVENKRPNLYAVLEGQGKGKTIILNGHTDTVPTGEGWTVEPFEAIEDKKGFIFGRGAADMKAGLASMIYAMICMKRLSIPSHGKIILYLNIDEEMSNLGMEHFLRKNIQADYAIISEPTGLDVNIGHKGTARYEIITSGTSGHAAYVKEPDNAIEKMNKLLSYLFKYSDDIKKEKQNELLGSASSNVTMINGGTIPNMIPNKCRIILDRRLIPGETKDSILRDYKNILGENIEYELKTISFIPPSIIEKENEFVQKTYQIVKKYNRMVRIKDFEATCEAPYFSVYKNIPTIIYGPGKLNEAHVVNEKVHRSELIKAGKSFIEICKTLLC